MNEWQRETAGLSPAASAGATDLRSNFTHLERICQAPPEKLREKNYNAFWSARRRFLLAQAKSYKQKEG
jgi:hypothetical protein